MRLDAFLEGLVVHSRSFSASCVDLVEVSNVCVCVGKKMVFTFLAHFHDFDQK